MNYLATIFKSRRVWGLTGTAVVLYFLFVVILGRLNMSWIMPNTREIARAIITVWPQMPFFQVEKEPVDGGQEVYYTVPTRQLTPQELTKMGVITNATAHPVMPKAK